MVLYEIGSSLGAFSLIAFAAVTAGGMIHRSVQEQERLLRESFGMSLHLGMDCPMVETEYRM